MTLDEILNYYPEEEILKADGFDDAVIGIDPESMRLVYDRNKMFDILVNQGMTMEEAVEYLEFNTFCAYVGEKTPLYILI
jgi:hypothetical protein